MDNIGGAEMVGLTLARELNADLYTTNIDQEKIAKMGFPDVKPISIGRVPVNAPFRQQKALWLFRRLDLGKKYDFYIIDGDWAMAGAVNNKPNLWYVHSPIREIWDAREYVREHMVTPWKRPLFDVWARYNRGLNRKHVGHVTRLVCNSENTRRRIKKFLGKEATVIHPPADTSQFYYRPHKNYWLSVNRLIHHKRVDMQLKAFGKMPGEHLIVVGSYEPSKHFVQYTEYLRSTKPSNVEIRHWVERDELLDLYAHCKGLIATAMDEDFGMAPVEAMASGKPVIAAAEGGYRESLEDGVTGVLINNIDKEKLTGAIRRMDKNVEKYKGDCLARARQFDASVFMERIKEQIKA